MSAVTAEDVMILRRARVPRSSASLLCALLLDDSLLIFPSLLLPETFSALTSAAQLVRNGKAVDWARVESSLRSDPAAITFALVNLRAEAECPSVQPLRPRSEAELQSAASKRRRNWFVTAYATGIVVLAFYVWFILRITGSRTQLENVSTWAVAGLVGVTPIAVILIKIAASEAGSAASIGEPAPSDSS